MPAALPSTSTFPRQPSALERDTLEAVYLDLRKNYETAMRGRGWYQGEVGRQREAMAQLETKLRAIAEKEASVRAEAYEMLEIVTNVIGELEDAGDDLVNEYGSYLKGRQTFAGGAYIRGLIGAVIRFINRWTKSKDQLEQLVQKQQTMRKELEAADGQDR